MNFTRVSFKKYLSKLIRNESLKQFIHYSYFGQDNILKKVVAKNETKNEWQLFPYFSKGECVKTVCSDFKKCDEYVEYNGADCKYFNIELAIESFTNVGGTNDKTTDWGIFINDKNVARVTNYAQNNIAYPENNSFIKAVQTLNCGDKLYVKYLIKEEIIDPVLPEPPIPDFYNLVVTNTYFNVNEI